MLAVRLFRILYRELSARPILAFTIASLTASFITAYADRKAELDKLIADTVADLNDRADEIEARIERAAIEEQAATFDADRWRDGGEIMHRIGVR